MNETELKAKIKRTNYIEKAKEQIIFILDELENKTGENVNELSIELTELTSYASKEIEFKRKLSLKIGKYDWITL